MKPGIYDMPAAHYHADPCPTPSLNAGLITTLLDKSPAHAFAEHPRLDGSKRFRPTIASDNGSLAHSLLFEGVANMVEIEAENYRTKAAQEARDTAREAGKIPVLPAQVGTIKGMVASAKRVWGRCPQLNDHPQAAGLGERSLFWTEQDDDGNSYWFRIRPDWHRLDGDRVICLDGKFTEGSAHPDQFARQIMRMDYHTRAAFYLRGFQKAFGLRGDYYFMPVEAAQPHEGCVVGLDENYLWLGQQRVEQAINLWMKCMRTKRWPGYGDDIHIVEAPAWALTDEVELLEQDEPLLETQA